MLTQAQVQRIEMRGNQAICVEVMLKGQIERLTAAKEILLCAGAINSPQLLMLSGIGPGAQLQSMGLETIVDSPQVGRNLMDHLEVYVQQACTKSVSLHKHLGLIGRAKIGVQWVAAQGLGATNHFEVGGFRSQ